MNPKSDYSHELVEVYMRLDQFPPALTRLPATQPSSTLSTMICSEFSLSDGTRYHLYYSCGGCMNSHRAKRCIHFDQFLQGNPLQEDVTEMFYLIKTLGRNANRGLAYLMLQVVPRETPFEIDAVLTPRCKVTNDFCYRCKRALCCTTATKRVFVKGYVDLQVCHTQCSMAVLEGVDAIPFCGSKETISALRYWHMFNHQSEYVGTKLSDWIVRDNMLSNGEAVQRLAVQRFGFDTTAATRSLTGKTPTDFKRMGKKQKSRRTSTGGIIDKHITPHKRIRAQSASPMESRAMLAFSSVYQSIVEDTPATLDSQSLLAPMDTDFPITNLQIESLEMFNNALCAQSDIGAEAPWYLISQDEQLATETQVGSAQMSIGTSKMFGTPAQPAQPVSRMHMSMDCAVTPNFSLPEPSMEAIADEGAIAEELLSLSELILELFMPVEREQQDTDTFDASQLVNFDQNENSAMWC